MIYENANLILYSAYFVLIFWNTYTCYQKQRKIIISFLLSFLMVNSMLVWIFIWVWSLGVTGEYSKEHGMLIVIIPGIIWNCVWVLLGLKLLSYPYNLFDNFRLYGVLSFKDDHKKKD